MNQCSTTTTVECRELLYVLYTQKAEQFVPMAAAFSAGTDCRGFLVLYIYGMYKSNTVANASQKQRVSLSLC